MDERPRYQAHQRVRPTTGLASPRPHARRALTVTERAERIADALAIFLAIAAVLYVAAHVIADQL